MPTPAKNGAAAAPVARPAPQPERAQVERSIWERLAEAVPPEQLHFRQDGKIVSHDGRHGARYVVYVDAGFVRERLDAVVPGQWHLRLFPLPAVDTVDSSTGEVKGVTVFFRARLRIAGVTREDVGAGKDYKQASTDAFKRVAARFGIGHDLRDLPQIWVPMSGNGRDAKPTKEPKAIYLEKRGRPA